MLKKNSRLPKYAHILTPRNLSWVLRGKVELMLQGLRVPTGCCGDRRSLYITHMHQRHACHHPSPYKWKRTTAQVRVMWPDKSLANQCSPRRWREGTMKQGPWVASRSWRRKEHYLSDGFQKGTQPFSCLHVYTLDLRPNFYRTVRSLMQPKISNFGVVCYNIHRRGINLRASY